MQCSRCQTENPPGSNFCLGCGARLALTCASCGADLPAGSRFCNKCGTPVPVKAQPSIQSCFAAPEAYTPKHLAEKILTSRSALEGERKQVTVLFVDVSGFTSLSERLDPEDVHAIMTRAFELMLAEVHRYEGTVNQFLGDGIMALFGAPIAHEQHARRAVHAAIGIRAALEDYREQLERRQGLTFKVRQGVNTGLVVVGSIGNDLRMDYTRSATRRTSPRASSRRPSPVASSSRRRPTASSRATSMRGPSPNWPSRGGRSRSARGRFCPRGRPGPGWRSGPTTG
jgi:Adenylate and Guanylate cyclase catalytic domain/Double zinc ribbon